jgi:hypothetical protein
MRSSSSDRRNSQFHFLREPAASEARSCVGNNLPLLRLINPDRLLSVIRLVMI